MKSFLQETAEDIVAKFGKDLSGIELIFPNKRTDFHFKKYLGEAIGKTSWSPQTYTIQQYACILTGLRSIDKISLLFELYQLFKQNQHEFNYTFDGFYKLGEIILHDFNEIDNYLADARQIFTNIRDIHEIDSKYGGLTPEQLTIIRQYWQNFSPEKKSREKEQFLKLWNILAGVYEEFQIQLIEKSCAYEGLIYKKMVGLIAKNELPHTSAQKIFIGFNALSKAQKKLFKYLHDMQKALFYWDNDSYYHHNKIQEAGDFLRKNYELLGDDGKYIPGNFKALEKAIHLIGIPGKIGQAKAIPQILKNLCGPDGKLKDPEKTVVVLPDENMLFPVLNSIPGFIDRLNITMGYPLKNTALYSLLNFFIRIQHQINQEQTKGLKIYHKDALAVLDHPYLRTRYPLDCAEISGEIVGKQMIYAGTKLFLSRNNPFFGEFFSPVVSGRPEDSTAKILNMLFILYNTAEARANKIHTIEDEYIYHTYIQVKRLHEIFQSKAGQTDMSFQLALQFIKQVLNKLSIPFESESTDGLQIMGLIETRNIDFENVIIINANEGILPKLGRPASLISESLRHAFELPVLKFQDSIFAYFFYRLLQRARNIYILYDNLGSSSRSGELSRFVYQLQVESGFEIKKLQLAQNVILLDNKAISIPKTKPVLEKLEKYILQQQPPEKQFSASSLDTYLSCPFRFYLRYIAGIKETEQVEEEFSPAQMGLIIHSAMENIYREVFRKKLNPVIEKKDFAFINQIIENQLEKAFKEHLGIDAENFEYTGNLLIIKEVILKYLNYILAYDEQKTPFEIVQMEGSQAFYYQMLFSRKGESIKAGISGIIDRIDRSGNELIIIDYKTGKADKEFRNLDELFCEKSDDRKKAVFQIFLYGLLVKANHTYQTMEIRPAIYDIRKMYKKSFEPWLKIKTKEGESELRGPAFKTWLDDFEKNLRKLFEEIFDPDIPFRQTEISENCNYCSYQAICGKENI